MSAAVAAARQKEAAAWANRAIAARPAAPVMGAAVITVEDGSLTVSGWDWETLTRYTGEATGNLPRTLVSGKLLADISSRLTGDVQLARDGALLRVTAGRSRFALNTMPGADYPNEPKPNPDTGVLDGFGEFVNRVAPSAGDPGCQPGWLQGVLLTAADGRIAAMATDRYIISYTAAAWTGADFAVNIPARRLHDIARHLDDKVTIGVGNGITLTDDSRHASILATDDSQANVNQYLDAGAWTFGHADVDRAELLDAVNAVTPTVGDKAPVRLYVDTDGITIKSRNQGVGESESTVDVALDGNEQALAVSPGYLAKALDATPADMVRIRFASTARKPILIHGLDGDGEPDLTTRHIVMPVRVDDIH